MCGWNLKSNINFILSPKEIEILRKAYDNYNICVNCLSTDVMNIMINEGISKAQAINKIENILQRVC